MKGFHLFMVKPHETGQKCTNCILRELLSVQIPNIIPIISHLKLYIFRQIINKLKMRTIISRINNQTIITCSHITYNVHVFIAHSNKEIQFLGP